MFRGVLQEITIDAIRNQLESTPLSLDFCMQQIKTLEDLKSNSPIVVSELDLHGNFILSIHPNFFSPFQNLKTLHLGIIFTV